jgi:hypothetical protein
MAIFDEGRNNGFYMPVAPAYGGYGNQGGLFGGDFLGWVILLLLIGGGGGWGLGGFGGGMMWPMMMGAGMGGFGLDYLYPWLNNSQHISDGFRDQQLNTQLDGLRTDVNRGFGDVQLGMAGIGRQICETGNSITGAVRDGFYGAEIAANNRQMASMQQGFALQSGLAENRYTISTEACANRTAGYQNTRDIIDNQNRVGQSIIDKLCQLELDNVKGQSAAKDREIDNLRTELLYARGEASRIANADSIVDRVYTRLKDCPVDTVPVFGNQRIWNCTQPVNNGCGCGNNGFGFAA